MRHLKPREIQGCDVAYQPWRPETLYDATSGGSLVASGAAVARCEDVSGNASHMTQGTGASQPLRIVAARNGIDALRFDGSNDFMSAGDVADMLANPVEIYAVFIRTAASTGLRGVFSKSREAQTNGRFGVGNSSTNEFAFFAGQTGGGAAALLATSTDTQLIYGHHPRGNASVTLVRNAKATASTAYNDTAVSQGTVDHVFMGASQNSAGTAPQAGSYIGGDIIECAKYSRNLGSQARLRAQHAAMRRARIAG